ncbi:MAG: helix-turn-helix transcriptional regulator [Sporolactobacillus sp.]
MTYDKIAVGERIRSQRKALGLTIDQLAERIGRIPKFCADIERGTAGMSIDTMLKLCSSLKITPDYLLLGQTAIKQNSEIDLILSALNQCTDKQRNDAVALLRLFLTAIG